MRPLKSDLVILVARRRESALFLDVLRDWSAHGLIVDFLLIDADAPLSAQGSPCLAVRQGKVDSAPLQVNLAARRATSSAHVVCLSQVDDGFSSVGSDRGGAVFREVRDALPAVDVTWVHAISVTMPSTWPHVDHGSLGWYGCHNVVLVPENSRAPQAGVALVPASPITPVRLTQQAAALCSAVGLWGVERRTPFRGAPPAGGGQLVALRTFTRHLDATAVTSRLVARALDVHRQYPVPTLASGPAHRLDDEAAAAADMANRLFAKHKDMLAHARSSPSQESQKPIRLIDLIGMFLEFFVKALRRAPQDFVDSFMHRASAKVAAAAQDALLGRDGSAYVVTANGIRGIRENGALATFEEYDNDLEALIAQFRAGKVAAPPEQHDYSDFWTDFVDGALTLLDAGGRSDELAPIQVGSRAGVVTDPRRVVVPPSEVFEVAPQVRAVVKLDRVSAYDVDGGRRTYDLLGEKVQDRPERAAALTAAQSELQAWFEERRNSYVGKVGDKLSKELSAVRQEIRGHVAAFQDLRQRTEIPPEFATLQHSLAKSLLVHAIVFVALTVVTVSAAATDLVEWRYAGPIALVLVLTWLLSATFIFYRRQRALFRLRTRMESDAELAVAKRAQLEQALEDLRRLQRVYRQYLDWASALGAFVQAPWGHSSVADEAEPLFGDGYPHNHRFGVAMPDEAAIDEVINRLRPQLFPVGWLGKAWAAFRTDLPPMGADRHFLEENPDLLFSDRAVSQTSILTQWSQAVAERNWTGGATRMRADIDTVLSEGGHLQDKLLSRVRSQGGDGSPKVESYQDFVEGLQYVTTGPVDQRQFSQAVFADVPHTSGPWNVSQALSNHDGRALPTSLVVTEISRGFDAADLAFSGRRSTRTAPPRDSMAPAQAPPQI